MPGRTARGFTLVEMMIALAILGLLILAALPEIRTWMQNTQIRTAAEGMVNGLQFARTEAVRRNTNIELEIIGVSGWNVTVDGQVIQSRASGEGSPSAVLTIDPAGATKTTFNGLGRQVPNGDGSDPITAILIDSGTIEAAASRELCVTVGIGGVVRLCDPQVAAGDTRACQPVVPTVCGGP